MSPGAQENQFWNGTGEALVRRTNTNTNRNMKSNYKAYGDGVYLKKNDATSPMRLTVAKTFEDKVAAPGKPPQERLVASFRETPKRLIINQTNGSVLAKLSGSDDTAKRVGTVVEVFLDADVTFAGQRTGGIRLRRPANEPF